MRSEGLFSQAIHGVRWIALTKGLSQFLMWIVTIYVVRLLTPEDYGIMAMASIPTSLAMLLLDAGLGAALVQRKEVPAAVYRSANSALLLGACFSVGVVQLLAWPLAQFFSEPRLEAVLRVVVLQFPISAVAAVPTAILMKQMRFKQLGITEAVAGVTGSLVNLALAWKGFGVWALVLGILAAGVVRAILVSIYHGRPVGLSLRFSVLRSYVAFSANLIAQRVVWFYVEQVDHLIIGRVLGSSPLGTYSVARTFSHIPLERTASVVNQVTLPMFAAVQDEKDRWHSALEKLIRLTSVIAYPVFFGMAAVAPVAMPLALGERWEGVVWPFTLFCVALPLRTANALLTPILLALGRADIAFKIVLIWAAILSPLFVLGAQFGVTGVAAAWAIGFPFVYFLATRLIAKSLSIPQRSLLAPMLAPAIAALGCVGTVFAVHALSEGQLPPIVILLLEVGGGAMAYGLLLRVLSRSAFDEVVEVARRFAGRRRQSSNSGSGGEA